MRLGGWGYPWIGAPMDGGHPWTGAPMDGVPMDGGLPWTGGSHGWGHPVVPGWACAPLLPQAETAEGEGLKGFLQKSRQEGLAQLDCPALCGQGRPGSPAQPARDLQSLLHWREFLRLNQGKKEKQLLPRFTPPQTPRKWSQPGEALGGPGGASTCRRETWAAMTINRGWNVCWCFPRSSVPKESACSAGDLGLIPGSGRFLGEGNGNPLQYSCLENPMDRGAWRATVHGVAKVGHDLAIKPTNQPTIWNQAL